METKPPSTPMDVIALLQMCRDIEVFCAEIYHVYADRYVDDAELHALWSKTFAEEENHARQFVMAINLRRDGAVTTLHLDRVKAQQMLEMVKSIYNNVLEHLPSKLDALRSAIKMEKKLEEFHLATLGDFQDESLRRMFDAMMRADRGHIEAIEKVYRNRVASGER